MYSAVKQQDGMQKYSESSENEKKDLCGQSPLVDTEILTKVKKTADFMRNQPFLMEKALIIDTICGDRRAIVPPL